MIIVPKINRPPLRLVVSILLVFVILFYSSPAGFCVPEETPAKTAPKDFIRWVDFSVPCQAMKKAISLDVMTHDKEIQLHWIEMLAYLASVNGNNWGAYRDRQLDTLAQKLITGQTMDKLTENNKYYAYYLEAYTAIFAGFVGEYEIEVPDEDGGGKHWEPRYGIKVFSPIAKNFPYSDSDDFGNARSYGYARIHLGHDMMGQIGTPIIAVEGGTVEALGWDEFGGWRIGIRSLDKKRYYYYAHLRQNYPYQQGLRVGAAVKSGEVIGYMGHTGYSKEENVNNIVTPHLHFGLELIFDESQKDSANEIWIDVYQIVRLLENKRSEVRKNPETEDYERVYDIKDLSTDKSRKG